MHQGKTHSYVVAAVIQLLCHVQLFEIPWTATHQASLCFTISQSLLKLTSIESVMPSNHFVLCRPLLLLPSIFHSIRVFSNGSALSISWPKYWNFCFSISPSNEYSELISFRVNWFDLLEVQVTPWLIGWAWVVLVLRETLRWGSLYLLS